LYGVSALCAAGAVVAGLYGFNGGGGTRRASGPAKPTAPGSPQQSRAPGAVENGPLALIAIDDLIRYRIVLVGPRGRYFRSLPICRDPRCGELTSAAWSPDGRTLAYGTSSGAGWHPQDGLHLFDLARNKDRRLPAGYGNWQNLAWSPDGTKLAYVDGATIQIIRIARPQRPTELTAAGTSPSWSPNGKLIAYDRFNGRDTRGIYVSRVYGSHVHRLSKWGNALVWFA
jgi:Tol biopolymer transport system component